MEMSQREKTLYRFAGFNAEQQKKFNNFIDSVGPYFPDQRVYQWGDESQQFAFHINQPATGAFKALDDGTLLLIRKAGQPSQRVRITPWMGRDADDAFSFYRYLHQHKRYYFCTDFTLLDRDWSTVDWANFWEIWGPFNGDTGRNPSLEIMLRGKKGIWEVRQRGDSRLVHDKEYETTVTRTLPFAGSGRYSIEVETVLDHRKGGVGETHVWINGVNVMAETQIQNTYNYPPTDSGALVGGQPHLAEVYSYNFGDEPIMYKLHSIEWTELLDVEPEPEPEIQEFKITGTIQIVRS